MITLRCLLILTELFKVVLAIIHKLLSDSSIKHFTLAVLLPMVQLGLCINYFEVLPQRRFEMDLLAGKDGVFPTIWTLFKTAAAKLRLGVNAQCFPARNTDWMNFTAKIQDDLINRPSEIFVIKYSCPIK